MKTATCFAIAALFLAAPLNVHAQNAEPPLHRFELAAGISYLGGAALGDANADLRSGTAGSPYRLFETTSQLAGTTALDLRAGFDLSRRIGFEAHLLFGHPELRTTVASDAEGAPDIDVVERLDQYLIDGGVVIRFDEFRVAGLRPFVTAGAGYLRQLHEGLTVIEEGSVFYAGGGVRSFIFVRPSGFPRAGGLRGDVRLNALSGGIVFDDRRRWQPSVAGSFFLVF